MNIDANLVFSAESRFNFIEIPIFVTRFLV